VNEVDNPHHQFKSSWIGGFDAAKKTVVVIKRKGSNAAAVECDVTKSGQVSRMVKTVLKDFGRIDILVNNAGVLTMAPIADLKEEEWDYVLASNAKGTFLCCREVIPSMMRQKYGRIINISSTSGLKGYTGQGHYCASKFAIIGLTETLALELAPHHITANVVCPGIVASQMWKMITGLMKTSDESPDEYFQRAVDTFIPVGRPQSPEDIGRTVVFVAAMENITGAAIPVCGGIHINSPAFE
jgi:meso-butanediol dehydrogenase/(S,S)-butanediol dehydrogenase/diacetyl reductase